LFAQELSLFGGASEATSSGDHSYAWALDYRHGLGEHAAITFSYLNEGHVPNHHRDGQGVQLWARTTVLGRRLALAAGAGPYWYYDTTRPAGSGAPYSDQHGWAALYSLSATYYTDSRVFYELRVNRVTAGNSINTASVLFGVGYQLDPPRSRGPLTEATPQGHNTTDNEVTLFVGRTVVNSFESEHAIAKAIEYRRGLAEHIDWSVSWLDEGNTGVVRRNGVVSQFWAVRDAFDRRVAIGAGLGAYLAVDLQTTSTLPAHRDRVSGIATISGTVRLTPRTFIRGSWNRVLTKYDRDTDVVLIGVGYRF
jgi:hypothetical protein